MNWISKVMVLKKIKIKNCEYHTSYISYEDDKHDPWILTLATQKD